MQSIVALLGIPWAMTAIYAGYGGAVSLAIVLVPVGALLYCGYRYQQTIGDLESNAIGLVVKQAVGQSIAVFVLFGIGWIARLMFA